MRLIHSGGAPKTLTILGNLKLVNEMPMGYHLACKAYINEKWVLVDATWDLPLKRLGFPLNESWDGVSNTLNAVKPEEEITHENEGGKMEYERKMGVESTDQKGEGVEFEVL
jgi:hypothetical protein